MYDSLMIIKFLPVAGVAALFAAGVVTVADAVGDSAGSRGKEESGATIDVANTVSAADVVRIWAEDFYLQRPLCGASEVRDVAIHQDRVLVRLDIDPKWEVSLNKLDKEGADRWFAIHCPLPVATAEHALGQRDIAIMSTSADNPHTNFSCREFERTVRLEAAVRKGGFRQRINAVLQRLGGASG